MAWSFSTVQITMWVAGFNIHRVNAFCKESSDPLHSADAQQTDDNLSAKATFLVDIFCPHECFTILNFPGPLYVSKILTHNDRIKAFKRNIYFYGLPVGTYIIYSKSLHVYYFPVWYFISLSDFLLCSILNPWVANPCKYIPHNNEVKFNIY